VIKKIILLPLVSLSVGTAVGFFLYTLERTIVFFESYWMWLIWFLPAVALVVGYIETKKQAHRFGDTESLLAEVKNPLKHVHWFLAPWIYLTTLVYHWAGASVGRESSAIQMSGSIAESLGRLLSIDYRDRPILIRTGLAAGFGAAFGVPWAGTVFSLESAWTKRKGDWLWAPFYLASSWGAYLWTGFLNIHHSHWQSLEINFYDFRFSSYAVFAGALILICLLYEFLFKTLATYLKMIPWWLRLGGAALMILGLTLWVGLPRYNSLGLDLLHQSFQSPSSWQDAFKKLVFTFISTVAGMKGGEVTPLMASGALWGSWLSQQVPVLSFQLGAAVGLVSLFCSRLRIPVTGTIMLVEFFGWKAALVGAPILLLTEAGHRQFFSKKSSEV